MLAADTASDLSFYVKLRLGHHEVGNIMPCRSWVTRLTRRFAGQDGHKPQQHGA